METSIQSEAFLADLRKKLAQHLAHNISFSLFSPQRLDMLRKEINKQIDIKLAADGIPLKQEVREQLVEDIITGLPINATQSGGPVISPWTEDKLRSHIGSYLAGELDEALFEPTKQLQLSHRIDVLVRRKVKEDELDVPEETIAKTIATFCRNMNVPVPEAAPAIPTPVPTDVGPAAKIPSPPLKNAGEATARIPADSPSTLMTEQEMSDDLKRQIFLTIGARLSPEIMSSGDFGKVREHVGALVDETVMGFGIELIPTDRENLIDHILSGDGLEFQL